MKLENGAHTVQLEGLGLDRGGTLLIKQALAALPMGARLRVVGSDPHLEPHLRAWCRARGQGFETAPAAAGGGWVIKQSGPELRASQAQPAGLPDPALPGAVVERPPGWWGLAARGASVEPGSPAYSFALDDKGQVWADEAGRLYQQAVASQWNPQTAIPWGQAAPLAQPLERAVTQVMTYLIENETVALLVPARFLGRIHPHFKEVMQLLAVQTADEARHIEVFTRRATLHGQPMGLSTAGGQASLKTLYDEQDFAQASFLLSVMGETSFLYLLAFLEQYGPDPVTREVCRLAQQDEARHVAFAMAHLSRHLELEPVLRERLAMAVHQRHQTLRHTTGLNEEVFDALVLMAAGSFAPEAVGRGYGQVAALEREMDQGRQRRLRQLGFTAADAEGLSTLHTRNFM